MHKLSTTCVFIAAIASPAFADCLPVERLKSATEQHGGQWIELTKDQWQFLRGIYAINPLTPPGLPFGDKAVLATIKGSDSGFVFFIDRDMGCTPMPAPPTLLKLMDDVLQGTIPHYGSGL